MTQLGASGNVGAMSKPEMSKAGAFLWGAIGGLLPVILSAATVDLAPLIDHPETLSLGIYLGYGIRVACLLLLGGVLALLNNEIKKPLALVQLGVAAPALVTVWIAGKAPEAPALTNNHTTAISIFTPAIAGEIISHAPVRVAGVLNDVRQGLTTSLGSIAKEKAATQYPSTAAPETPAVGRFCATSKGRFGPGPAQPLGADCSVALPSGSAMGKVTK